MFKTEQSFNFIRLNNWLKIHNIKSKGFKVEKDNGGEKLSFEQGFHASGHASEDELVYIIDTIDPEISEYKQ